MKRVLLLIGLLVVAFLEIRHVWNTPFSTGQKQQVDVSYEATTTGEIRVGELVTVAVVFDGDTIELTDGRRVRYIGIDAPEVAHAQKSAECFGDASTVENKRILDGKMVRLVKDTSEVDSYGRLLRYVYVENVFVNAELVANGFARAWNVPPDEQHKDELFLVQQKAKESSQGLWQVCKK